MFVVGIPDFNTDIVKQTSYTLTIDDVTPPTLVVVDSKYTVVEGDFATVNDAILSNIVAIDNLDSRSDIALYVSGNGGMSMSVPGSYTVEVTGEDQKGNVSVVSYTIKVVAKEVTTEKVDEKVDGAVDEMKDFINQNTLTEAEIQALIAAKEDAEGTSLAVTIVVAVVAAGLAFGGSFLLFRKRP